MLETLVQSLGQEEIAGEEIGNPLPYSSLGNPIDREAWWATVHGVINELNTTEWLNNNDNNMINIPRALKDKVYSMQTYMGNKIRKM